MSAKGLFITGTDTGVGKTLVSKLLLRSFAFQGQKVIGMKPVASGAVKRMDGLENEDALALLECSSIEVPYHLINPYCFEPPIAPHIAAEQAGTTINLDVILDHYRSLAVIADLVVVEGVGGWSVPLSESCDMSDLALQLDLPVILVVGIRLGCINHALLTAQSIQAKGCNPVGWIANIISSHVDVVPQVIESLEARFDFPLLASIPILSPVQNIDISNVFNIKTLYQLFDN